MSPAESYGSADAVKAKFFIFKGVYDNVKLEEFIELIDFNKITHAEDERVKSKRSGRDVPFIKMKGDNPKQAEALVSDGFICQKAGIIFKVDEFRTTPSIQQCFKYQGFGHNALNCTKNVLCGAKYISTKAVHKKTEIRNV